MKRITNLVLASALIIGALTSLVSCGETSDTPESEKTAITSLESAEVSETDTVSSEITPEKTQQAVVSEVNTATTVSVSDGYIKDLIEIPHNYIEQLINEGKEMVIEDADHICGIVDAFGSYDFLDDVYDVEWVGHYYAIRGHSDGSGASYFEEHARNALCLIYQYNGTDIVTEKSATGYCYVFFEDLTCNNGSIEYAQSETSSSHVPDSDLARAKESLYDYIIDCGFIINADTLN